MRKEKIEIAKDRIKNFTFNEEDETLMLLWETGGHENATCGIKFKIEVLEKIKSTYKAPHIPYNSEYKESF